MSKQKKTFLKEKTKANVTKTISQNESKSLKKPEKLSIKERAELNEQCSRDIYILESKLLLLESLTEEDLAIIENWKESKILNKVNESKVLEIFVDIYLAFGRSDKALENLEKLIKFDECKTEKNYTLLGDLYCKNNHSDGEKYYIEALKINKKSVIAKMGLADFYLENKNIEKLKEIVESLKKNQNDEIMNKSDKKALYYFYLGSYLLFINNYAEAEELIKKSLSYKYTIYAGLHLAEIYCKQKKYDEYINIYNILVKAKPNDFKVQLLGMNVKIIKGNLELKDIDLKDLNNKHIINITKTEIEKNFIDNNHNKTIKLSIKYLDQYPNDIEIINILGKSYLNKGKLNLAKKFLEKSYEICQTQLNINEYLGDYYYTVNDYKKAIYFYETELKNPNKCASKNLFINIAKTYFVIGDFKNSIKYINCAIELDNDLEIDNSKLHMFEGFAHFKLEDFSKALKSYRNALSIEPSLYENIVPILKTIPNIEDHKDLYDIIEYYDRIEEHNKKQRENKISSYDIYLEKAHIYFKEGNLTESKKFFDLALEDDKSHIDEINLYLEKIAAKEEYNKNIEECRSIIETSKNESKSKLKLSKLKLEKKSDSDITKENNNKIWGDRYPSIVKAHKIFWSGLDKNKTKIFGWVDRAALNDIEEQSIRDAEKILENGSFTSRASNQQGIKFYNKNNIAIKKLGNGGDIRIIGRRIKDETSGLTLYVFDKAVKKHSRIGI